MKFASSSTDVSCQQQQYPTSPPVSRLESAIKAIKMTLAEDVNTISTFVSHNQVQLATAASTRPHYDCIVLCVSAIFHCAETLFSILQKHGSDLTSTVVLCGGIGHSTTHLYSAVARNARYAGLSEQINGLPEAQVMEKIFDHHFDGSKVRKSGVRVLVEDKSTNCGANATETRKLLQNNELLASGSKVLIIQDPTMSLRTKMSFEKAFEQDDVTFKACPSFVPTVTEEDGRLKFDESEVQEDELWGMDRFLGLILGEVVRLRDDEMGYGPKGEGFIGHVDMPNAVLEAYGRLEKVVQANR